MSGLIVDAYAGPGGWSEGLRMLGLADIGIEWDAAACATRAAAGHATIRADVAQYPPERFAGAEGAIFSPPCPDWSVAGKRAGRAGRSGHLIDIVPVWVEAIRPRWVACEQVPPCLPIWQEHAARYRQLGYSTWCGILNAADYGVPQTRQRAFLLASLDRPALPPEPTHCRGGGHTMFGTLRPWVSMADALGWEGVVWTNSDNSTDDKTYVVSTDEPAPTATSRVNRWVGFPRRDDRGDSPDGYRERDWYPATRPAPVLTEKARSFVWVLNTNRDQRPDGSRQHRTEPIRLTLAEALTLQSFPPGYPVQGTKTKQFEQVGNACPPLLSAHVISAVTGIPLDLSEAA